MANKSKQLHILQITGSQPNGSLP
uniref:Uncharacterized protein n=1 Tax=Arundo donax TaxID=35708 RepID=A0A0A8ZH96_ARUDO